MHQSKDDKSEAAELDEADNERKQEFAIRAVEIIQTVVEDLDERGKRMWRKMLGIDPGFQSCAQKESSSNSSRSANSSSS